MFLLVICTVLISVSNMALAKPTSNDIDQNEVKIYSRDDWKARCAKDILPLNAPAPYVVIHHSYEPKACYTHEDCVGAMRSMQDFHMDSRGWWDIGYNFAVGSDGAVYEGRGWHNLGAHSLHFNNVSIGIVLIGDWRSSVPPSESLDAAQALLGTGVTLGFIKKDYKLVGHRQVRETDCPGDALQSLIQQWPHFTPFPHSYKDLEKVFKDIRDSNNE